MDYDHMLAVSVDTLWSIQMLKCRFSSCDALNNGVKWTALSMHHRQNELLKYTNLDRLITVCIWRQIQGENSDQHGLVELIGNIANRASINR